MPHITFTDEDFKGVDPSLDDPMVISVNINKLTIMKTLVDQGSLVDILYRKTFKQMRIVEEEMKPYDDHMASRVREWVPKDISNFIPPSTRER